MEQGPQGLCPPGRSCWQLWMQRAMGSATAALVAVRHQEGTQR
jgi:hypothetical protein